MTNVHLHYLMSQYIAWLQLHAKHGAYRVEQGGTVLFSCPQCRHTYVTLTPVPEKGVMQ